MRRCEAIDDVNYHGRTHFCADTPRAQNSGRTIDNQYENVNIQISAVSERTQGTRIILKSTSSYIEWRPQTPVSAYQNLSPCSVPQLNHPRQEHKPERSKHSGVVGVLLRIVPIQHMSSWKADSSLLRQRNPERECFKQSAPTLRHKYGPFCTGQIPESHFFKNLWPLSVSDHNVSGLHMLSPFVLHASSISSFLILTL